MKKIKTILIACFLISSLNFFGQTTEVVYIRVQELIFWGAAGSPDSYMRIIYPDKKSKLVELSSIGKNGKSSEENGIKIQQEISTLINEGFEIKSCSVGADNSLSTTIIILTRRKEK